MSEATQAGMGKTRQALFLGVLVKMLSKLDDQKFGAAINGKNLYADWIRKNIGDEKLAAAIEPIHDRQALIADLNRRIAEISGVYAEELSPHVGAVSGMLTPETKPAPASQSAPSAPAPAPVAPVTPAPVAPSQPTAVDSVCPQPAPQPTTIPVTPAPQSAPDLAAPERQSVPAAQHRVVIHEHAPAETVLAPDAPPVTQSTPALASPQPAFTSQESSAPDSKKAAVFLTVLARRLKAMDDAKFTKSLVGKNPYAAFIQKMTNDAALADAIEAYTDWQQLITYLEQRIASLTSSSSLSSVQTTASPAATPATGPAPAVPQPVHGVPQQVAVASASALLVRPEHIPVAPGPKPAPQPAPAPVAPQHVETAAPAPSQVSSVSRASNPLSAPPTATPGQNTPIPAVRPVPAQSPPSTVGCEATRQLRAHGA